MELREYLFYNKITMQKMAALCGVSSTWIQHLKNGDATAGKELARKIEEITGGQVKADSLIKKTKRGTRSPNKNIKQKQHDHPDAHE